MRNTFFGLALFALPMIAGSAYAAGGPHPVSPKPGVLAKYIANAKGTPIKFSASHNSQQYKLQQAIAKNPGAFRVIKLGASGPDFGRTAYLPRIQIKGLKSGYAYISSQSIAGPHFTSKVALPPM